MGTLNHICIALAVAASAHAQSATRFETRNAAHDELPAVVRPVKAKPALADTAAASIHAATPSRLVAGEELESYLESMVVVFSAMSREKDPFGQYQDPDAKPEVPIVTQGIARRVSAKATPLSEIVARLDVTTIMPGEQSFLIGSRKVKVGQELPLVWRGKSLRVAVTEVSSSRIAFRDVESGETGDRTMDILPVGMSIGNGQMKIAAPGMVSDRLDAPIELDGDGGVTMTP
jgi:hypothetical protein